MLLLKFIAFIVIIHGTVSGYLCARVLLPVTGYNYPLKFWRIFFIRFTPIVRCWFLFYYSNGSLVLWWLLLKWGRKIRNPRKFTMEFYMFWASHRSTWSSKVSQIWRKIFKACMLRTNETCSWRACKRDEKFHVWISVFFCFILGKKKIICHLLSLRSMSNHYSKTHSLACWKPTLIFQQVTFVRHSKGEWYTTL